MQRLSNFHKTAIHVIAVCALSVAAMPAFTQQPGGGPKATAEEQANIGVVEQYSALIMQGKIKDAFEKYVSKDYVEHSHLVRTLTGKDKVGYDDTLAFIQKEMSGMGGPGMGAAPAAAPAPAAASGGMGGDQPVAAMSQDISANDDMVAQYGINGVDVFRLVDGKIVAHWDTTPKKPVQFKMQPGK